MQEETLKLALLEQKLLSFGDIVTKLDSAIEKMSEVNANITKMLAIHEMKLTQTERTDELIIKMIEGLKEENFKQHQSVNERIEKMESKIEELSRIKWMTVGIGIFAAVLATTVSTLASGWIQPSKDYNHHTAQIISSVK
jgi:hypothetical protein